MTEEKTYSVDFDAAFRDWNGERKIGEILIEEMDRVDSFEKEARLRSLASKAEAGGQAQLTADEFLEAARIFRRRNRAGKKAFAEMTEAQNEGFSIVDYEREFLN